MPQRCRTCSRINPDEAHYCYYDGVALDLHGRGPLDVGTRLFVSPFVFPSGRACRTFNELVLACESDWEGARQMLRQGHLESFLGACGRGDLAQAARQAARAADPERALDELLSKMPGDARQSPRLYIQPQEVNLGRLRRDEDRRFVLHLENQGMGLLAGSVTCEDAPWLALGDGAGAARKVFQCRHELRLPVRIQGKALRAGNQPLEGRLIVATSGGNSVVLVRAEVPVQPFPEGVLAGARSPRQAAEKAREYPQQAAPFFERGAVAAWYEANGWTYPVQGPPASGLGAVQQFFEALGLARAPRVEISQRAVHLQGPPGVSLEHALVLQAVENRPVFAHATTGAGWLRVGHPVLQGRYAHIPLRVPEVPAAPGQQLSGKVLVTANGNQRFVVDVTLSVGGRAAEVAPSTMQMKHPLPSYLSNSTFVPAPSPVAEVAMSSRPIPAPVRRDPTPPVAERVAVATAPAAVPVYTPPPAYREPGPGRPDREWADAPRQKSVLRHLLPLLGLALALLIAVVHDLLVPAEVEPAVAVEEPIDPNPLIEVRFHDRSKDDKDRGVSGTMRFGLVMLRESDPNDPKKQKKLTFDEWGRTNNTCLRVDSAEVLFGSSAGVWTPKQEPLGPDARGRVRSGTSSRWQLSRPNLLVTQEVEVVPGQQSRKLDTCAVRYILENQDSREHRVGIRFLLDTYIGANDGVPFYIPRDAVLCETQRDFATSGEIPDFLLAWEKDDPKDHGTEALLQLRLGNQLEAPTRVTLGGWPNLDLRQFGQRYSKCQDMLTMWDVPLINIRELQELAERDRRRAEPDSAVTMYWQEQPLQPGGRREVGFAYGLGMVSSGNRLLLTVGGRLVRGGDFTLAALVQNPVRGETLTLTLPEGLTLVEGSAKENVPEVPAGASRQTSPVTWRLRASKDGRYVLKVKSSQGDVQEQPVRISTRGVFD
jgi:hypothetical protein